MHTTFSRSFKRLARGVPLHAGRPAVFRLECDAHARRFRGVVLTADQGEVLELYEGHSLDVVRRIVTGYHSSLCRYFGPARLYAGI